MIEYEEIQGCPLVSNFISEKENYFYTDRDRNEASCDCNYFFPVSCFKCDSKICQNCVLDAVSEGNKENTHKCFLNYTEEYPEILGKRAETLKERELIQTKYNDKLALIYDKLHERKQFINAIRTQLEELDKNTQLFSSQLNSFISENSPISNEAIEEQIKQEKELLEQQQLKFKNANDQTKLEIVISDAKSKFLSENDLRIQDLSQNSAINSFLDKITELAEEGGKAATNEALLSVENANKHMKYITNKFPLSIGSSSFSLEDLNSTSPYSKAKKEPKKSGKRHSEAVESIMASSKMDLIREESQSESSEKESLDFELKPIEKGKTSKFTVEQENKFPLDSSVFSGVQSKSDIKRESRDEFDVFGGNEEESVDLKKVQSDNIFEKYPDFSEDRRDSDFDSKWNKEKVLDFIENSEEVPLFKKKSKEIDIFRIPTLKTNLEQGEKDIENKDLAENNEPNETSVVSPEFVVGVKPGSNEMKIYDYTDRLPIDLGNRKDLAMRFPCFPEGCKFLQHGGILIVSGGQIDDSTENIHIWSVDSFHGGFKVDYFMALEMQTPRKYHNMVYIESRESLIINGGLDSEDKAVLTTEFFDLSSMISVGEIDAMLHSSRINSTIAVVNNTFLLTIGGHKSKMESERSFNYSYEILNLDKPEEGYREMQLASKLKLYSGSVAAKLSDTSFCIFGGEMQGANSRDMFVLNAGGSDGIIEHIHQEKPKNAIPANFACNTMFALKDCFCAFDSSLRIVKYSVEENKFID